MSQNVIKWLKMSQLTNKLEITVYSLENSTVDSVTRFQPYKSYGKIEPCRTVNASKCHHVSQNVTKRHQMTENVIKWLNTSQNVIKRHKKTYNVNVKTDDILRHAWNDLKGGNDVK